MHDVHKMQSSLVLKQLVHIVTLVFLMVMRATINNL